MWLKTISTPQAGWISLVGDIHGVLSHVQCWEELTLTMTWLGKENWKLCIWNSPGLCPLHLFSWLILIVINYKGEYNRSQWVYKYFSWIIKPKCGLGDPHTCNSFQKWGGFVNHSLTLHYPRELSREAAGCWMPLATEHCRRWLLMRPSVEQECSTGKAPCTVLQKLGYGEAAAIAGARFWRSHLCCRS